MQSKYVRLLCSAGLSLTFGIGGCQWSATDDEAGQQQTASDLPKSYPAAVERLEVLSNTILTASKSDDPDERKKADGALHEIGHVIRAAPKLADASGMSPDDQAAIQQASDDLFSAFDEIHGTMHVPQAEAESVDYEAIGRDVEQALDVLQSKVSFAGDAEVDIELEADEQDHDHEEGDDHHHEEGGEVHDHAADVGDDE